MMYDWVWIGGLHGLVYGFATGACRVGQCAAQGWGIDWRRIGWKVGKVRSQLGRSGYDADLMLRVLLPGQWHSLPDWKLEEALRVRLDFMLFCGASLFENVPDHRTLCGFRCALLRLGLFEAVPGEVNRHLCAHGLKVEHAAMAVAVVVAAVIESAGWPRRLIEGITVDCAEEAAAGACPLHHAGESRGGVNPQSSGDEPAQGNQSH